MVSRNRITFDMFIPFGLEYGGHPAPLTSLRFLRGRSLESPLPCDLADSTGELDTATSAEVFGALRDVNRDLGVTIVVVTHDPTVSGQVERTVAIRDGRTSSEVLRRTATADDGGEHVIAEEYAVMDRAGRVQIPADYREALALTRRVRLALEPDHVTIRPDA